MYPPEMLAKMIDYAVLRPDASRQDLLKACEESRRYHFAALCVFPCWVPMVAEALKGSDVKVCAVVGFPYGANAIRVKAMEARLAISHGAGELDVVINIGAAKSGNFRYVADDLAEVVAAAHVTGLATEHHEVLVKAIVEAPLLTLSELRKACKAAKEAGVDFIKTATGTVRDAPPPTVRLLRQVREVVGSDIGIKVSGGIRTLEEVVEVLDAGANRIGTSSAGEILEEAMRKPEEETEDE